MLQVRYITGRFTDGDDTFVVVAESETFTAAQARRREQGVKYAVLHEQPCDLELWSQVPNPDVEGELMWVYVDNQRTTVSHEVTDAPEYDDDVYPPE